VVTMAKVISDGRPKCPSCYGSRQVYDQWLDEMRTCDHCDGQGFDPYYTKQHLSKRKKEFEE